MYLGVMRLDWMCIQCASQALSYKKNLVINYEKEYPDVTKL